MDAWLLQFAAGQGFLPHGYCFQWSAGLLSLMVGSDLAVMAAYYTIPIALIVVIRARKDVRLSGVFWLFSAFIFLCGTTHLVDVLTIWVPAYWLQAYTKFVTAAVSVATAIGLWTMMPKLLKLPSNEQLTRLVGQLEEEVSKRREAQARLDELNHALEARIAQRTLELEDSLRERERLKDADRAREVAEAKDRAKSEFLSRMSHELRTPLNAVMGFAQLMEVDPQLPERPRDWARQIELAGRHLLSLVDDVLDLARIEAKGIEPQRQSVSLNDAARECESMLAQAAKARDVNLAISVEPPGAVVMSDARRLKQVFMNLVSNAIKYNRPGGSVDASIAVQDQQLCIRVSDTGVGMTEQQRSQLFAPFNRLGKESDPRSQGTGLGLAITKQVVEALGGRISVESRPGLGSKFTAVVPAG